VAFAPTVGVPNPMSSGYRRSAAVAKRGRMRFFARTGQSRASSPGLKALRPVLCSVVDGEDHDVGLLDGIRSDEGRIRNDQLTGAGNPASSARYGEGGKLLNAGDDLHCDPGGNFLAIGESDVIVSLIQLLGSLLGPFDHWRARPVFLSLLTTSSWLTTRPFRISSSPSRTNASW